jgi:hypothetical protein
MTNWAFLLLLFCSLISCDYKSNGPTIQSNGEVAVIDSAGKTDNIATYLLGDRGGYYPIFYIGPKQDSIRLGQAPIYPIAYGEKDYFGNGSSIYGDSHSVKIFVDTTFDLAYKSLYRVVDENYKGALDSGEYYKSFPIFVYNLDDSLIHLGIHNDLAYTIRQAKNEQGNWIDLELPIAHKCGTYARHIVLEPNEMLIAKFIRFKGDIRTEFRLKFTKYNKVVYSNSFVDYIDKKQLTDKSPTLPPPPPLAQDSISAFNSPTGASIAGLAQG